MTRLKLNSNDVYFSLEGNLNLTGLNKEEGEINIRQSDSTIFVIKYHLPGVYSFKVVTRLSYSEKKESYIDLKFYITLGSITSQVLPESLIENLQCRSLSISDTNKFSFAKDLSIVISNSSTNLEDQCYDLHSKLVSSIEFGLPFSIIRLGDGEGRFLGFPEFFGTYDIIEECIGYQFGPKVFDLLKTKYGADGVYLGIKEIKNLLQASVLSADIVCAPDKSRIDTHELTDQGLNALSSTMYASFYARYIANKKFVPDVFIFYMYYEMGFLENLIYRAGKISYIAHTNIDDLLMRRFGLSAIEHIQIPGHQTFMSDDEPQFPNFYHSVVDQIWPEKKQPHIYLVSAGYLGKYYCHVIKIRGGFAIDIGSLFDAWAGKGRDEAANKNFLRLA